MGNAPGSELASGPVEGGAGGWAHPPPPPQVDGVEALKPLPLDTPLQPGMVRFVCISDTHSKEWSLAGPLPPGDVLLHAGDFSNTGKPEEVLRFNQWLGTLPYKYKVVIAGNHDLTFDETSYVDKWRIFRHPERYDEKKAKASLTNCIYLEDQEVTVMGYRIYGSPWQPWFCDWAFNLERGDEIDEKWKLIPEGVDILMTHGPPYGHGDWCTHGGRAGCERLLKHVQERVKPKYHVFGHIHEGYSVTRSTDPKLQATTFINPSTCSFRYRPQQAPIIFDLPARDVPSSAAIPTPTPRPAANTVHHRSKETAEFYQRLEANEAARKAKQEAQTAGPSPAPSSSVPASASSTSTSGGVPAAPPL